MALCFLLSWKKKCYAVLLCEDLIKMLNAWLLENCLENLTVSHSFSLYLVSQGDASKSLILPMLNRAR